ncbi:hypothetical protein BS50DRAFT_655223 [Corynespora cassiicola Philippines]|uniref:Uncharacterized protein n=1 Tax=Corynespora cassiicola Philippines TaxID=1448308 RepID=A0A2T2N5E1_CORCC|nr:hypothetical protein BS50DRAFT_655223 [Corynespora cassiicola Philippines]
MFETIWIYPYPGEEAASDNDDMKWENHVVNYLKSAARSPLSAGFASQSLYSGDIITLEKRISATVSRYCVKCSSSGYLGASGWDACRNSTIASDVTLSTSDLTARSSSHNHTLMPTQDDISAGSAFICTFGISEGGTNSLTVVFLWRSSWRAPTQPGYLFSLRTPLGSPGKGVLVDEDMYDSSAAATTTRCISGVFLKCPTSTSRLAIHSSTSRPSSSPELSSTTIPAFAIVVILIASCIGIVILVVVASKFRSAATGRPRGSKAWRLKVLQRRVRSAITPPARVRLARGHNADIRISSQEEHGMDIVERSESPPPTYEEAVSEARI